MLIGIGGKGVRGISISVFRYEVSAIQTHWNIGELKVDDG